MLKKVIIIAAILAVVAFGVYGNMNRGPTAIRVQVSDVAHRELVSVVSGSGKIRPFKEVDISSNVMGEITEMSVEEGEVVQGGQFLLRIDPVRYRSAVEQVEASIAAAETNVRLARENREYAQEVLDRREGLYRQDLLSRESYDDAVQSVRREERNVQLREQELSRLQAQLRQSEHDLSMVTFTSPIDGVITRLNVEQGETAVTGTMNNPGTVLMTIADLSVVEAEIEIDETDIVSVDVGQRAEVRIDAFPDQVFQAVVSEVGKSPIQAAGAGSTQAINFKVVVRVTEEVPLARPGLSCTADVITATRDKALAVPIQSLILREFQVGADGNIVRHDPLEDLIAGIDDGGAADDDTDLQELEGAFVVRDGLARFVPIVIGIAGERHFEVLDGLQEDDQVIIGPFDVLRSLQDGERVETQSGAVARAADDGE